MAARKEQEAIAVVLDIGPGSNQAAADQESFFNQAVDCIVWIIQRKILAESKDEIAIVLCGTADTKNDLSEAGDGYENITVAIELQQANWKMVQFLRDLTPSSVSADFVDAMVVAMDHLVTGMRGKKFTSQKIVLFSNFCGNFGDDQMDKIIRGMSVSKINLTVVGPDMDDDKDVCSGKTKTAQQRAGERVVKKILEAIDGETYSFEEAVPHLTFFQKKTIRSTPWRVQLDIGPDLQIPVGCYLKISECKPKGWKPVYARDENERLETEVSYHVNDEAQTEVKKEDTVEAFRYGSTLVPFTEEDRANMAYNDCAKCLSVLGFTKQTNIQRHHYLGDGVRFVAPERDDEVSAVALSALIHALYELECVAIVRYAYSARSQPKIGFLAPRIKANYECLVFVLLPFMEDLRRYPFAPLTSRPKHKPTEDQLDAVDNLITAMDLTQTTEDGETVELLKPKTLLNPYLQRLYQCLSHRALNPGEPLPEIEPQVKVYLEPVQEVTTTAQPTIEKIKRLFPLQVVVKKKDGLAGADVFTSNDKDASDPKRARVDGPTLQGMAQLAHGPVTEIGTVNPVDNFKVLLSQPGCAPAAICKQMQDIILRIVTESFGYQFYTKALDCLKILRSESVKYAAEQFNSFLLELKLGMKDKGRKDFWELLVKEKLTLIIDTESPLSKKTSVEAAEFLQEKDEIEAVEEDAVDEDADDLLAMM